MCTDDPEIAFSTCLSESSSRYLVSINCRLTFQALRVTGVVSHTINKILVASVCPQLSGRGTRVPACKVQYRVCKYSLRVFDSKFKLVTVDDKSSPS